MFFLSGKIGTKGWGDDGPIETLGVDCIYTNSNVEGRVNAQSVLQLEKEDPTLETIHLLCTYMPYYVVGLFIQHAIAFIFQVRYLTFGYLTLSSRMILSL